MEDLDVRVEALERLLVTLIAAAFSAEQIPEFIKAVEDSRRIETPGVALLRPGCHGIAGAVVDQILHLLERTKFARERT